MIDVSLYIPCFNVATTLVRCIEGVQHQTYPVAEVLIIDDGSSDHTLEIASRYPVRLVRHARNQGLAAARNTAFREARCDIVAALDADCVADPHWLAQLLPVFDNPQVAMAGGRLVETMRTTLADRWRTAHMSQDWGMMRLVNPRFMYGNNSLSRKAAVLAVGGYNERYRTNGEDVDLSRRLYMQGYQMVYDPTASVSHLRQDTLASILRTYRRYWNQGSEAYRSESSLTAISYNTLINLRSAGRKVLRDLKRRNFDLIWLDLFIPLYMFYYDVVRLRKSS